MPASPSRRSPRIRTSLVAGLAAAAALGGATTASAAPMAYFIAGLNVVRAPLDGSGAAQVIATGNDTAGLRGIALDPARGLMVTSQALNRHIRTASLSGGAFTDVATGAAHAVLFPAGLSIDPATGTVFWAGEDNRLGRAVIGGSGGALIPITGVSPTQAYGAAYEPGRQLLWWSDVVGNAIHATPVSGAATTTLPTGSAPVDTP